MIGICILTEKEIKRIFPLPVYTQNIPGLSFAEARNLCLTKMKEDYVLRIDTDEEVDNSSIARFKEHEIFGYDVVNVRILNIVDNKYKWIGYKGVFHKRSFKYIGITHEMLYPTPTNIVYDQEITFIHRKSLMEYAMSHIRDYLLIPKNDEKYYKLRSLIFPVKNVAELYRKVEESKNDERVLNLVKTFKECKNHERDVYLYYFGEYPPGDCATDLPNYVAAAEELLKKYEAFPVEFIEYYALRKEIPKMKLVKL